MAMDPIPPLRVGEVIPGAVSKRDPDTPTAESSNVVPGRIAPRSPMERSSSAERQPKLVITERQLMMPTHAHPRRSRSLWSRSRRPSGNHSDWDKTDDSTGIARHALGPGALGDRY